MADVESDDGGSHPVEITPTQAERLAEKRQSLFEEFEIGDRFPRAVRTEVLERTTDVVGEIDAAIDEREDLRELPTWTIDPVDAQDFDDAISIRTEESAIRLWVHIADVSHYVQPGTAMWTEAIARGNTVYLPGYTVHMLPPVLAETVCSLVPTEDRLAHTVEMELDPETLSFESIEIYKSVIHSDARLTYREAEAILDGRTHPLADALGEMYTLAEALHEQRKADGSLVLNPRRDRAHTIVEEAMLKANRAVTHELMWSRGVEAMYRVHPQPTPSQWDQALREIVEIDGVSISRAGYDEPRRAVNEALESAPARQLRRIQRSVLKVMPRAKYMADPFGGHYALNFDIYGHFTSPIRRLSDLINHWIVDEEAVEESVDELCAHASRRQKETETAERLYRQFIEEMGLDVGMIKAYGAITVDDGEVVDPQGLPPS
jgi:Exoribonuclease R